jgi:hypothetical protein
MSENSATSHESFGREDTAGPPPDRNFGITMAIVFLAFFCALGFWTGEWNWWLLLVVGAFAVTAAIYPAALSKLNVAWFRFGLMLHKIVNPLVLGLIFAFITPIGWVWRQTKKDPLRLRFDPAAKSYWIEREPAGPKIEDFPHQF